MFEDLDHVVESLLRPTYANTVGFLPTCDINETKDHYLASFARTVQIQTGEGGFLSQLLGQKKEGSKDLKDVNVL